MSFHAVEQRCAVIQVHTWLSPAPCAAFGQPDRSSLGLFPGAAQDELKTLLDQRCKRRAAPGSFLPGSLQKSLVQANRRAHMSEHTA